VTDSLLDSKVLMTTETKRVNGVNPPNGDGASSSNGHARPAVALDAPIIAMGDIIEVRVSQYTLRLCIGVCIWLSVCLNR
jgi:hypothetical protein